MAFSHSKNSMRRVLIGAGAILLLAVAAALFLLPRLINREMVREKIVHLLSQKIAGTVTFLDLDISLFPLPRVIMRNASLAIPDKLNGTIRTVTIFPELLPLFRGEVRLAKIQVDEPSFTVRIPAEKDEKTKSLDEIAAVMRSLALGAADISFGIDEGSVILEKPEHTPVSAKKIAVSLKLANTKDEVVLTIGRLSSKDPGLSLSGEFRVNPSGNRISLEATGRNLDIPSVRNAALALGDDVPVVLKIFDIMRNGTVEQITFKSSGSAPADLGKTANIKITGRLDRGGVMISDLGLDFRDVSGYCEIRDGILYGKGLKGQIMRSRISDGTLSIGLKGRDALFQADAAVAADLTDVHLVLSRIVKNPDFHTELGHIKAINGKAEGRLVLGESLGAVRARVDIAKMKFSANYDRVPLPITVAQGSFSYDEKGVAVNNLAGTIGKSALSGLSARVQTGSYYLELLSGQGKLDTAEVHRWLSSYEKLKEPLRKIASLSGRINLSSLRFQGLIRDSQAWNFKISGSVEKLMLNTPLLPGQLALNSGKFETQAGQFTFSDANTNILDASSMVSGYLNTSLEIVRKGDIRFSGTVGPRALQWIKSAFRIPEYIRTDQTVAVSDAHLIWQKMGDITFQSAMKTGGGQSVLIELAKGRDGLTISRLDLSDSVSKALLSIDLQEKKKQVSFKGRLYTSSAAELITTPQIQGGMVQGEMTAGTSGGELEGIVVQGNLRGEKIVLPWRRELPLIIDSVALSAKKGSLVIDAALLRLGVNTASLKGSASSKSGDLVLEIDVSSDRIVWDALVTPDGDNTKESQQTEQKRKPLTVHGVVRLKTELFDYQGMQIAPFNADFMLSVNKTDIRIGRSGFCGVNMTGDVSLLKDGAGSVMDLDVHFTATDQELKPTILCLSRGKSDASGRFTLKGNLKGSGKAGDLKKIVSGKVELTAKKGNISRYKTLDTVFDFLNKGEELGGQMPDLDKSELAYELLKVTASVGKGTLVVEEAIIDSAVMEVVAQGSLNLMDNQLDLNVMVAPLRQVNSFIGKVPIVGTFLGGSVISVPVRVTGTPAEPHVTYLSPSAVASSLAGMMKRTLNLPVSILSPLFPKGKQE
ncbi:MAG: AsmA-like C-terminal domain-containing protein [Nitrospirae bacterium]|nr:AsmA-like C-terminal domain-containing protein [Nitrospirota bacterium]